MTKNIQPSKYYYVRANNSLRACLELMKSKDLTFLLVENHIGRLVGIFTLKDILKNYPVLQNPGHLSRPIKNFMSKPVISIPSEKIHQAAKLMRENKIQHLPVTSSQPSENSRILGVVDAEALLEYTVKSEKRQKYQAKDILVYSPNGALLRLLKNVLKKYELLKIDKMWASRLKSEDHFEAAVRNYDLLFFDLSETRDLKVALKLLPYLNKQKKRMIGLTSRDSFLSGPEQKDLKQMTQHSRVKIFYKPFEVHDLVFECLS
jgi:CBS domain-containing protein